MDNQHLQTRFAADITSLAGELTDGLMSYFERNGSLPEKPFMFTLRPGANHGEDAKRLSQEVTLEPPFTRKHIHEQLLRILSKTTKELIEIMRQQ